jgi:hypothetical protein
MKHPTTIITVLAILVLCSSALAMDGSGTETDPYIITNVDELQAMRDDLSAHYQLGNDIDATGTAGWFEGAGFEPVGTETTPFTGVFDGMGHVITGLYINRPITDGVGMFGYIRDGAEVMNVGVADVDVTARRNSGPLVGSSSGSSIFGCWSSGTITGSYNYQMRLGGLIGITSGADSFVSQCHSSVTVVATGGAHQVGGLSGYNGHGSVIIDCYATGDVSGYWKVGGLVGDNPYPEGGYITRCYSTGRGSGIGGGLVGFNYKGGVTYDSYWDVETSGKTTSYGGTPKTTEEMMQQATFVNWDFGLVWNIIENVTYPFFGEPPLLIGLEIAGPNEVAENHQTRYHAIAIYDNNSTSDVTTSTVWSVEPNTLADIDQSGLLTTPPIYYLTEDITIYAQYTQGSNTVEAEKPVSIFAICPSGSALEFDGVDDYVNLSENAVTTTEFTISAWANHYGQGGGADRANKIFNQRDNSVGDNRSSLGLTSMSYTGEARAAIRSSIGSSQLLSSPAPGVNEWHHYAMTVDSVDLKFYIDGDLVDSETNNQSGDYTTSIDHVYIGRMMYEGGLKGSMNGAIDEVIIYNRALSAEEIHMLMHTRPDADEQNLVGCWNFDEGEGQVVYDLSPNANHGRLGSDPDADNSDPAWVESDAPTGICTPEGLVERNVNDALEIKLNILQQIEEALLMEDASVNILDGLFGEAEYGHLDKRDIIKAKQEIHSAIQGEEQAIDSLEKSAGDLEDSLEALSGDDDSTETPSQGNSPPGRQSKTLTKPAPSSVRKPSRK